MIIVLHTLLNTRSIRVTRQTYSRFLALAVFIQGEADQPYDGQDQADTVPAI